jgi:transposase InsO family protein
MIAALRAEFPAVPVRRLCALLGVGHSWYYEQRQRTGAAGAAPDDEVALRDAIERLILEFPGDGYRRVTRALQREGWAVNHKRVLRVMRQESLLCQLKRRFVATTDSAHGQRIYPHLLTGVELTAPDQA